MATDPSGPVTQLPAGFDYERPAAAASALPAGFAYEPAQPQRASDALPQPDDVDRHTTAIAQATVAAMAPPVPPPAPSPNPSMNAGMSAQEPGVLERIMAPIREGAIGRAFGISSETAASRKEDPSNPVLRFEADSPHPGVGRGLTQFASGLTTPENLLLAVGTGGVGGLEKQLGKGLVTRLMAAGFSGKMLVDSYQQIPALREAWNKSDWPQVRQTLTRMTLGAGMAALGATHAVKGGAQEAAPNRTAIPSTPPEQEYTSTGEAIRTPAALPAGFEYEAKESTNAETKSDQKPAQGQSVAVAQPGEPAAGAVAASPAGAGADAAAVQKTGTEAAVGGDADAPAVGAHAHVEAVLPRELAGAKPRYNYGGKTFTLDFESDLDKAAYIAAQKTPSKADAKYVDFVAHHTGKSEAEIRSGGGVIRATIKAQAKDAMPGKLTVPAHDLWSSAEAPAEGEESGYRASDSERGVSPGLLARRVAEVRSGTYGAAEQEPRVSQMPVHQDIAPYFENTTTDLRGQAALDWVRGGPGRFARGAIPHPGLPDGIGLLHGENGPSGFGVAHIDEGRAQQGTPNYLDEAMKTISSLPLSDMRIDPRTGRPRIVLSDPKTRRFAIVENSLKGHDTPAWLLTSYGRLPSDTIGGVGEAPASPGPTPPGSGRPSVPPAPEGAGGAPATSVAHSVEQGNPASAGGVPRHSVPAAKPEPGSLNDPTYMGSGLGALQPLFDQAKAEGDALRARRNDALAAAKAAADSPAEKKAGEKVRAYLTSERDWWAARTNQAIDIVTRKVLPKIQDREAVGIAREFRHQPLELQAFIDGTHPFLEDVDGGPSVADKNLKPLIPVLRQALRILSKPTQRERAADATYTNIATRDLAEGRAGGWLESRWQSDQYVPHLLNPKGEGEVAKAPSTAGRAMGQVGKYFGFGERRSDRYPTMVHAVADGVIPKTLDPSAAFTVHADQFARARATHLLEAHLAETGLGKWGDRESAPEGWKQLAAHTEEFKKRTAFVVPNSFQPETGESELGVGTTGLYVPEFLEKALGAITDPDYTAKLPGFAKLRTMQRGLKEAILGLSGFHLLTENFMAAADIGPAGMYRAFQAPRDSAGFLADERDLISSGGTTSIQGSTMDAYRGLRPGTIPTRAEVVRAYLPGTKQALQVADAVTRFTFDNMQRRFKVVGFALHRDAWLKDNPLATPEQEFEAKKGIASYVNGVYGGLHWENMGIPRALVEVSRALFLAPDWSGSNIALAKYATDARVSASELPFRNKMAGAVTKESAQARLSRAFWTKQLVGGLAATQMLSLLFSGKLSKRPFQVYEGDDKNGEGVYQNVAFRGSIGDAVNLAGKIETHAGEGYAAHGIMGAFAGTLIGAGVFVQGKAAPVSKLGLHLLTGRDDFGRTITPGGLASDVLPIPITARTAQKTLLSDESDKYLWSEKMLSLFGTPGQHVAPAGMRLVNGELREIPYREAR